MPLLERAVAAGRFPSLDCLPWRSDPLRACAYVAELLAEDNAIAQQLAVWVSDLPSRQRRKMLNRSVEKSTHYKWFLGGHHDDYAVWIHQYRPASIFASSDRFAASVHNHRYPFVSRVLSGSLYVSNFGVSSLDDAMCKVSLEEERALSAGDVMFLNSNDVHRIDRVLDGTATIVIQGPPVRHYSTRFDLRNGRSERIYDLDALFPDLVFGLHEGRTAGSKSRHGDGS
jgi:hypothetical protein